MQNNCTSCEDIWSEGSKTACDERYRRSYVLFDSTTIYHFHQSKILKLNKYGIVKSTY